jgi:hypothetical protein
MKIKTILGVLVVGALVVLAGPPGGTEARSRLNSNAASDKKMNSEVKSTNRHPAHRRHSRRRGWSHHLHPGW